LLLHLIMDRFVSKIPGSPPVKAFGLSLIIAAACAYPVFGGGRASETRQGHDLFSQEKPEVIASQEEQKRRQERQGRPQS
jgi:hypothetical protein